MGSACNLSQLTSCRINSIEGLEVIVRPDATNFGIMSTSKGLDIFQVSSALAELGWVNECQQFPSRLDDYLAVRW